MKQTLIESGLALIIGLILGIIIRGYFVHKVVVTQTTNHFISKPDSIYVNSDHIIIKYIPSKPDTVILTHDITNVSHKDTLHYTSYKTFSDSNGTYNIKGYAIAPIDSFALDVISKIRMQTVTVPMKWYSKFEFGYIAGLATALILLIFKVI